MASDHVAPVKSEYLISTETVLVPDDDAAEGSTSHVGGHARSDPLPGANTNPGARRKKLSKEERRKQRGQNKGRKFDRVRDELRLCWRIATDKICELGSECKFTHDVDAYLAAKPKDILYHPSAVPNVQPPFIGSPDSRSATESGTSIDFSTVCPVFSERGECSQGFKCRFLGGHVHKDDAGVFHLTQDEHKMAHSAVSMAELNFTSSETIKLLRSRKFPHPKSDVFLKKLAATSENQDVDTYPLSHSEEQGGECTPSITHTEPEQEIDALIGKRTAHSPPFQTDVPDVPLRFAEKKRLHWTGKTYLAPLTTVGNLPFRRLCVTYGADITCGEMGLATSFLAGSKEEWSLIRRHPSEAIFGVQLAGNKPASLVPTAEMIAKEYAGNIDFVDLNCGCPIDLVFKGGSGSALLNSANRLGKIVAGMNWALGEIPVTVKLRTGVLDGRNVAHKIMPRLSVEWNAGCISLHGRTRQQRYSKLANWDYIRQCVDAVRAREAEEDLPRVPIFGGGDCFSSEDYWSKVEMSGVDGVMIGRGALIKPWIFTEIKEHREWDISSRERLEGIRKYVEFGLKYSVSVIVLRKRPNSHPDQAILARILQASTPQDDFCLLERLPARINDRAPAFRGRDELETLLASSDCQDWVKISEIFLGPAPENWTFTPKHKSNAHAIVSQG